MRIDKVLKTRTFEIVKDVNLLKILFDFYKAKLPNGVFVLNTTPHEIGFGREVIRYTTKKIIDIFAAQPRYEMVGTAYDSGLEFVRLAEYVPVFIEYKNNIIQALDELDIYAIGSVITVEAFRSLRVVGLYRENAKIRNGFSFSRFITAVEVGGVK